MTNIADQLAEIAQTQQEQWRERARCRGSDPTLFFPDGRSHYRQKGAALALCGACPVQKECLQYALSMDNMEQIGIWGGTTRRQRVEMKRNPRKRDKFFQQIEATNPSRL